MFSQTAAAPPQYTPFYKGHNNIEIETLDLPTIITTITTYLNSSNIPFIFIDDLYEWKIALIDNTTDTIFNVSVTIYRTPICEKYIVNVLNMSSFRETKTLFNELKIRFGQPPDHQLFGLTMPNNNNIDFELDTTEVINTIKQMINLSRVGDEDAAISVIKDLTKNPQTIELLFASEVFENIITLIRIILNDVNSLNTKYKAVKTLGAMCDHKTTIMKPYIEKIIPLNIREPANYREIYLYREYLRILQ